MAQVKLKMCTKYGKNFKTLFLHFKNLLNILLTQSGYNCVSTYHVSVNS